VPLTALTCHQFCFGFSFHENNKFDIVTEKMKEVETAFTRAMNSVISNLDRQNTGI